MTASADLHRLHEAAATTAAVNAASELGILDLLEEQAAGPEAVAARLELSLRGTTLLLNCLAGIGLVDRVDDSYLLTRGRASALRAMAGMWGSLAQTVRVGSGPLHVDTARGAEAVYGDTVGMLSDLMTPVSKLVAKHLLAQGMTRTVLEVGAGASPWGRDLARLDEAVHVTALDLPSVLEVTHSHVQHDGLESRYSYIAGDAFHVELGPAAYDLILLPHVCHLFDPAANHELIARLAGALTPRGRISVIDVLPAATPEAARQVSLYALGLMIRSDTGRVHGEQAYREWLTAAGLTAVQRWDTGYDALVTVVTGAR